MADVSNPFATPTEFTNVVLIVEGNKLHVNKELLSIHSPVFSAMFFGEFAEKEKEEVEIKDVVYKEFVDLLNMIHPRLTSITANSITHILKLADQFQMKGVMDKAEDFLKTTAKFNIVKKLILADQYRLQQLKDECFNSFKSANDIYAIKDLPEYAHLSDALKLVIFDKMMSLGKAPCRHQCRSCHNTMTFP